MPAILVMNEWMNERMKQIFIKNNSTHGVNSGFVTLLRDFLVCHVWILNPRGVFYDDHDGWSLMVQGQRGQRAPEKEFIEEKWLQQKCSYKNVQTGHSEIN